MTYPTIYPASVAQVSYIKNLLEKRLVPSGLVQAVEADIAEGKLTSRSASAYIDTLKNLAWKPKAAVAFAGNPELDELNRLLAAVPKAGYAFTRETLARVTTSDFAGKNDLGFFETREYNNRRYFRRLTGAPGGFMRHRVSTAETIAILSLVEANPLEATQRFAAHYSVCGKCYAELTDEESRRLGLGPVCRKAF
jgi:hypothetical protein